MGFNSAFEGVKISRKMRRIFLNCSLTHWTFVFAGRPTLYTAKQVTVVDCQSATRDWAVIV